MTTNQPEQEQDGKTSVKESPLFSENTRTQDHTISHNQQSANPGSSARATRRSPFIFQGANLPGKKKEIGWWEARRQRIFRQQMRSMMDAGLTPGSIMIVGVVDDSGSILMMGTEDGGSFMMLPPDRDRHLMKAIMAAREAAHESLWTISEEE